MQKVPYMLLVCWGQRAKIPKSILGSFSQLTVMPRNTVLNVNTKHRSLLQEINYLISIKRAFVSTLPISSAFNEADDMPSDSINTSLHTSDSERRNELTRVTKFLRSRGCTTKDINEKCLEYIKTTHSSYVKAMLISELHSDIVFLMPLMSVSLVNLRMANKQSRDDKDEIQGFPNRISYLSHHLETPLTDLIPALAKHSSLLTMQFRRLEYKMDILKDAEISPKYIVKDLWIFNYNEQLLLRRISAARKAEVELKPWMLRCSEKIFNSMLTKSSESQRILNGDDEISYLAKKLDCNKDYVEYIMDRNKLLKSINIPKLEQVLNFLYGKGYTPQEVRLFPRVFCSSVQTMNRRFEEYRSLKSTLPTMSQLCMSGRKPENEIAKKNSSDS